MTFDRKGLFEEQRSMTQKYICGQRDFMRWERYNFKNTLMKMKLDDELIGV